MKPIRILHLEDSKFDAEVAERELKISHIPYKRMWVTNKSDFRKALEEFEPDIVLSDHSLPSFSSMHAMKMMRNMGLSIPFILITGTVSEEFAANSIKEGASDYLLKDNMQRLPDAIMNALQRWRDEKKRVEYLIQLERNEQTYRTLVEHLSIGIFIADTRGRILYQNPAAEHISGITPEELRRKSIFKWIHADDLPYVISLYKKLRSKPGSTGSIRYRIKRSEHYMWIETTVCNMLHNEQINGFMVHFRQLEENGTEKIAEKRNPEPTF